MTNKILIILSLVLLASCGPSAEEKRQVEIEQQRIEKEASEKLAQEKADRVAAVTCSIMSETRNMDGAVRVEKMNEAREKIGGEAFLRGDDAIKEAFQFGLCSELVLNENYDEALQPLKDAKRERERIAREKELEELRIAREKELEELRIAREKRAEERRIAAEKKAEERRIAAEKQRIESERALAAGAKNREIVKKLLAEGKEVSLHANGQISMIRPKKDSLLSGNVERFYKNGQMMFKAPYQNGQKEGISEYYDYDGNLTSKKCFKDGSEVSLVKCK